LEQKLMVVRNQCDMLVDRKKIRALDIGEMILTIIGGIH